MLQPSNEQEQKVFELEQQLYAKVEELRALKATVPPVEITKNYSFETPNNSLKLIELFGDQEQLILVHNMGKSCNYCALWADGLNGFSQQFPTRAAFVVVSPDKPEIQKQVAEQRGWKFSMVSDQAREFTKDMGFFQDGKFSPGISTYSKDKAGKIFRHGRAEYGPGDQYCSIWHVFDMLPGQAHNWDPIPFTGNLAKGNLNV